MTYIDDIIEGIVPHQLHLAVFSEPYLSHILEGRKTIEARFSRVRCAPFRRVAIGDVILIKQSGGPIRALTRAFETAYFHFDRDCLDQVRNTYGTGICADNEFWELQRSATYATIISLVDTIEIQPMGVSKRDRRGWVPLADHQKSFAF